MQRVTVVPAVLPSSALAELKDWLAITTTREDSALTGLLRASLDTCTGFTRQVPLATTFEEIHPVDGGWQVLGLLPVRAITGIQAIAADGSRTALAGTQYLLDLDAEGIGRFRLLVPTTAVRLAVTFSAGLAATWDEIPAALRHGLVRLAAFNFRAREGGADAPLPPAAVAALWRPWRRLRIA